MKSYNVKIIFKSEEDREKMKKTLILQKDAWNICSEYRLGMKNGDIKTLHDLSYYEIKKRVNGLPSQYIIKSIRDVISTYATLHSNKVKLEEPAFKKNLSCRLDKRLFDWKKYERTEFSITTIDKRIKANIEYYDKLKEFDLTSMIDPLIFERDGEFYLTLTFNDEPKILPKETSNCVGIDLGIRRIFATSKGDILKDKKSLGIKRKIRFLKRKLKSKSDSGSRSAKKSLKKLKRREKNFNKNWTHHVVNKALSLNEDCSTFVIEDLKGIKRTKNFKKQGNMKSQWNPFEFRRILTYKAQALGKGVETVKPYLTSQLDHRGVEGGKRMGCRYIGGDGKVLDADVNAAINILKKSLKRPVSCSSALDGQVRVNEPYEGRQTFLQADCSLGGR